MENDVRTNPRNGEPNEQAAADSAAVIASQASVQGVGESPANMNPQAAADADQSGMTTSIPPAPTETDLPDAANETAVPALTDDFSAQQMPLQQVLEAILFSSDVPLSGGKLAQTLGLDSTKPVKQAIEDLNTIYQQRQAAYRIEERAGGYQILTLPQYAEYVQRLMRKREEGKLTPAALETLAIVAYKQPILRVDVETIRGVACGEVLRTLMEYNLVKIVGRAEEVGRPMLYGTTKHFLEVFGLAGLKDLPKSEAFKEPV